MKSWKTISAIVLLHVVLYVVFVGEAWVTRVVEAERSLNHQFLGEATAKSAEDRADRWFTALFIDTGVSAYVFGTMVPSEEQRARSQHLQKLGEGAFTWWESRLRTWWTVLYQAFSRVSSAILWWPYAAVMLFPFVFDGVIARKVKATDFSVTSPHLHLLASRSIEILLVGYVLFLFLPFQMHPVLVPLLALITSFAVWLGVSQFAKRA